MSCSSALAGRAKLEDMTQRRILFLGGTGIISSASSALAVERGHAVTFLNRGRPGPRPVPEGVEVLTADVRDAAAVDAALAGREFDVVADFLSFTPDQVRANIDRFGGGRAGQYVFISSASAYAKPVERLPITESTPLKNPFWQYSRDKIAGEEAVIAAWREIDFPGTIVRPSHTYDAIAIPTSGGWTDVARMRAGKPVVVHGDGTTPWTLTHTRDFAVGFLGLLGRPEALGEAFHITADHSPTWDRIYRSLAAAAGVEPTLVHVASESIAAEYPQLGPGLIGDKAHSVVFDTTKLRRLVPEFGATTIAYSDAVHETIEWYDAHPEARVVDDGLDAAFDRMVARFGPAA